MLNARKRTIQEHFISAAPVLAQAGRTGYGKRMMTLLIEAPGHAGDRLARTFAALIPAVVEGIVLDAIVLNSDGSADIEKVADAAGAICVAGRDPAAALEMARGDWLVCLEPGARPHGEWVDAVTAALADRSDGRAGPLRFRPDGTHGGLSRLFRRPRALRDGLIIDKRQATAARAASLEALARGRAARRLAARITPADDLPSAGGR